MSAPPSVRPATVDDVAAIDTVVDAAYARYLPRIGRRPAPMTVDYHQLVAHTDHAHVLVDEHVLVGVLIIVVHADHLLIDNVAVAPDAQGRGYGRTLLAHAEHIARTRGLVQMRLYTNAAMTENLTFYRRLGYQEVDRRSEDGFERVYFHKQLG